MNKTLQTITMESMVLCVLTETRRRKLTLNSTQTSLLQLFLTLSDRSTSGPRFYNLAPSVGEYSKQDTPKVDGLACSFLLSSPDVLAYGALYDAVMSLLPTGATAPAKASLLVCEHTSFS